MNSIGTAPPARGFLGGRLYLRQAPGGHRAGTDAVLLAAAAPREASGLALDVGAGVGAVGLALALFSPRARVGLVEIDPGACELARENIAANGLGERVFVHEGDVSSAASRRAAGLAEEQADFVLTNPPYYEAARVRVSPDEKKARAHVAKGSLEDWVRACLALLRPGGTFVMIHRADTLGECLASVEGRLGALAVLPVLPREGEAATRILLRGKKGSKAPLALLAPLVLHEADDRFTPLAEAIHRGEAGLPW
jgi:tRNA1(Val) A37 N6-methylase TrmN6